MVPGRNRMLLSAARVVARELGRAGANAQVPAAIGRLDPVPAAEADHARLGGRHLAVLAHYGLYVAVAASVLAFFGAALDKELSDTPFGVFELAIGAVMVLEGLLVVSNWRGGRRLLILRLHRRAGAPSSVVGAFRWRLIGAALFVVGVAWVGVGAMELAQGAAELV